jgi:hypothetical protein
MPPRIENAPGLAWKPRKAGWEARWQARTDLVERGYRPKSYRIWQGQDHPDEIETAYIQNQCSSLQSEMLVWGRGGIAIVDSFDGTVSGLIRCYQHDEDTPYRKLRYRTRKYYQSLCKRLEDDFGERQIAEIKARGLIHWHEKVVESGHIAMAHSVMGMLRILTGFGATILEDAECNRLSQVLSKMRFTMSKPRTSVLTAEQAVAIRGSAHALGRPSVALAQAFQFDCMFRQKDVIGEWVPVSEPGLSDILDGNNKWLRGIRWEEINGDWILTHITSKRQKEITVDLKLAPMVMEELAHRPRNSYPARGPVIISDVALRPWYAVEFRKTWRRAADNGGIPRWVRNMDSRAGAITEATESGAELEHIKHAATHSDIGMTQRYARGATDKIEGVMRQRAEYRKNKE